LIFFSIDNSLFLTLKNVILEILEKKRHKVIIWRRNITKLLFEMHQSVKLFFKHHETQLWIVLANICAKFQVFLKLRSYT